MNKKAVIHFLNRLGKVKIVGIFRREEIETISSMNENENQNVCDICDLNDYSIKMSKYSDEEIKNIPKIYL